MYLNETYSRLLAKLFLAAGLAVVTAVGIIGMFTAKPSIIVAVVGAVLLILCLVLSGNPRLFCLWGLIISAPFNLDISFMPIPHMGGGAAFTFDFTDIFIAPLLVFLFRDFVDGYRRKVRLSGFTFLWGGLMVLGVFSIVVGPLRIVPAHEVFRMAKLLLLFLVFINEVVRVKQFMHVFAALMVGVALQCFVGLAQFGLDLTFGAQILGEASQKQVEFTSRATYGEGSEFTRRIGAFFGHPNLLAIYLAMLLPIGIGMLYTRLNPLIKFALAILIAAGLVVLVLTLSRSGWVSFAAAFVTLLGLTFVHPATRTKYLFGRLALIAGTAFVAVALSAPILKRLFSSPGGSVNFRWEWMEVSWNMILAKPVFGFGLNTFVFVAAPYTDYGTPGAVMDRYGEGILPVVHNIYLLVWSEQGTIGFLLFLALNAYLFIVAWRNTRYFASDALYMINAGCFAGLVALGVDGMSSFFIRNEAPGRVFILVAALIVAIHYWNRTNSEQSASSIRSPSV